MQLRLSKWAEDKLCIKRVFVFGSFAKSTANLSSDVDIGLDLEGPEALSELIERRQQWASELGIALGRRVDIYPNDGPVVVEAIERDGILVFERNENK